MSEGLICLNCRLYIRIADEQWRCKCEKPRPSWDGKTEVRRAAEAPAPGGPHQEDDVFTTGLTDAERERLSLLIEECGEVIQAACKVLRHGWDSANPLVPGLANRDALEKELGQLTHAVDRMCQADDIVSANVARFRNEKASSIGRWLHFQGITARESSFAADLEALRPFGEARQPDGAQFDNE